MSHFNALFTFGYFPLGFYSVYPSDQCPLNPSVRLHWGQRPISLSFSTGEALILFPSQRTGLDIWVDWCRLVVAFWKHSFRSHYPDICLGWRICGPWREPAFCGKDKGLHTCPGETKEASTSCRSWKRFMVLPLAQPRRAEHSELDLDLGNKAMLANLSFTLTGKRKSDLKVLWCFEFSIPPENL